MLNRTDRFSLVIQSTVAAVHQDRVRILADVQIQSSAWCLESTVKGEPVYASYRYDNFFH